jgi:hypothetical protein
MTSMVYFKQPVHHDQISTWGTLAGVRTIPINTLGRLKPKLDSNCCEGVIVKWGLDDFYNAYVDSEFYVDLDKIQMINESEESKDKESKDEESKDEEK